MKKRSLFKAAGLILAAILAVSAFAGCEIIEVEKEIEEVSVSYAADGTAIYTVTYDDGTTFTYEVEPDGDDSPETPADPAELRIVEAELLNLSYLAYNEDDPRYSPDPAPYADIARGEYSFAVKEGEKEVLYATVEGYFSLFSDDLKTGYSGSVITVEGNPAWRVKNSSDQIVYLFGIDTEEKAIVTYGDIWQALKTADIGKNPTLNDQIGYWQADVSLKSAEQVFSFDGYGLDPMEAGDETYYPFGLFDVIFQHDSSRHFEYSSHYDLIMEYSDDDQKSVPFTHPEIGENVTISSVMSQGFIAEYGEEGGDSSTVVMPIYALNHTKNLFIYLMDNLYGLAETLGFKSMRDYIENTDYADGMLSQDNAERARAYSKLLSGLCDAHTAFRGSAYLGESGISGGNYYQTLLQDRTALRNMLTGQRSRELEKTGAKETDVRYSADGKTAYFSFDSFDSVEYYGVAPDENKRLDDTYYLFVRNLNEIRNHNRAEGAEKGSVERVVIDDSVNGGGYVFIMSKLLALMSEDNNSVIYMKNCNNGTVTRYRVSVDSNGDGLFDADDCFGRYFSFYIVTSAYSFSCGNAFPYFAAKTGCAKIVGGRSGGGECTIVKANLPLGQGVYHSSLMHLGWYDEERKTFDGVEKGAAPHLPYSDNFYDVEKIAAAIIDYENQSAA